MTHFLTSKKGQCFVKGRAGTSRGEKGDMRVGGGREGGQGEGNHGNRQGEYAIVGVGEYLLSVSERRPSNRS